MSARTYYYHAVTLDPLDPSPTPRPLILVRLGGTRLVESPGRDILVQEFHVDSNGFHPTGWDFTVLMEGFPVSDWWEADLDHALDLVGWTPAPGGTWTIGEGQAYREVRPTRGASGNPRKRPQVEALAALTRELEEKERLAMMDQATATPGDAGDEAPVDKEEDA